jgi:hypothetical protein
MRQCNGHRWEGLAPAGDPDPPLWPLQTGGTMLEQRLFRLGYEAVALTAAFDPGAGWRLTVTLRRQDERWDESHRVDFSHLSTAELADVIEVACLDVLRQG